jgi:hypothetical protein
MPSYLHPVSASLLCPHPQRDPLRSGLHQVARALQSRLQVIPVLADLNPQLVSVLVSEFEQDQARVWVPTMARRRVAPLYALAYSVRLMLSQGRRRHPLPRQNLNFRLSR